MLYEVITGEVRARALARDAAVEELVVVAGPRRQDRLLRLGRVFVLRYEPGRVGVGT